MTKKLRLKIKYRSKLVFKEIFSNRFGTLYLKVLLVQLQQKCQAQTYKKSSKLVLKLLKTRNKIKPHFQKITLHMSSNYPSKLPKTKPSCNQHPSQKLKETFRQLANRKLAKQP